MTNMKNKIEKMLPKITFGSIRGSVHVQFVRCNKPNCKCKDGELHGPYFYYFTRINGKRRKRYLKKEEAERVRRICHSNRKDKRNRRQQWNENLTQLQELRENLHQVQKQINELIKS
jgi:hypothetical protein